jgi:cytochrome b
VGGSGFFVALNKADIAMQGERVVVWDLPTRIFHWLLAAAFLVEWLTQDDARYLDFHVFCGYLIGGLIAFRVIWGFVGTRWARFSSFAFGPFAALRYLRDLLHRRQAHFVGHNPAGSWAIFILLTLGALSVLSGVAALGGEKQQGPLRGLLTFAQGDALREVHEVLAWTMLVVVATHLLGVVVSSLSDRENLPAAMIRGRKRAAATEQSVSLAGNAAIAMLVVLAGFAAWYFRGYFKATRDVPYLPFVGPALATDGQWQHECGSCHLAFHPSLLPARSWQAMLEQQDHFGEDLALDAGVAASLSSYARAHSAEHAETPAAWKIASRTPAESAPLRITEISYWKRRHADVTDADWQRVKKIECAGCHLDAELGTFEPGAIHIGKVSGGVRKEGT